MYNRKLLLREAYQKQSEFTDLLKKPNKNADSGIQKEI